MLATFNFEGCRMLTLQWSETLALGVPAMDTTHREFVDLLAEVVAATDVAVLSRWDQLVEHTDEHFSREDHWMKATGFSSTNCHSTQHQVVLQVMREGAKRGAAGELGVVRQMADELAIWFPHHAQSMDAALALHLRSVGYDEQTGLITLPQALPQDKIEGCHGNDCDSNHQPATTRSELLTA
jgi:hemerythrin-like metal-binding protein